jgi:hypothetical protein
MHHTVLRCDGTALRCDGHAMCDPVPWGVMATWSVTPWPEVWWPRDVVTPCPEVWWPRDVVTPCPEVWWPRYVVTPCPEVWCHAMLWPRVLGCDGHVMCDPVPWGVMATWCVTPWPFPFAARQSLCIMQSLWVPRGSTVQSHVLLSEAVRQSIPRSDQHSLPLQPRGLRGRKKIAVFNTKVSWEIGCYGNLKWRQYVSRKRWYLPTSLHGVTTHKNNTAHFSFNYLANFIQNAVQLQLHSFNFTITFQLHHHFSNSNWSTPWHFSPVRFLVFFEGL